MKKYCIQFLLFFILLSGCGGGGEDSGGGGFTPSNQSAAGIWQGSFHSNTTGNYYQVVGIIAGNGIGRFILNNLTAQYSGTVSVSGAKMSGDFTAYATIGYKFHDGSTIGAVKIVGDVDTKKSLVGTYEGVGENGTYSLSYDSKYERKSSLSTIAGTYKAGATSLTIETTGALKGSSGSCTYTGNAGIINESYNAYLVSISIDNCGALNGTYSGLGTLGDTINTNDTLSLGVSKDSASMTAFLLRQ